MSENSRIVMLLKTQIKKTCVLCYKIFTWPFGTAILFCGLLLNIFLDRAKSIVLKILVLWLILFVLSLLAILLYGTFYNIYVPTAEIKRPVYLTFSVCPSGNGICSFPTGNVTFWNDEGTIQEVLTVGQPYAVNVELDIPDSPANRELGMFLVSVKMLDKNGQVSLTTQRSVVLKYRSIILRILDLLLWIPLYIFKFSEQKQLVSINMFSHYVDDYYHPSLGATVEVHSHKIEVYSTTITFSAKFTGLKYLLYHWPILSGSLAFLGNLLFLAMGMVIAAYQKNETLFKIAAAVKNSDENKPVLTTEQKTYASSSTMTENIKTETQVKNEPVEECFVQEPSKLQSSIDVQTELRQRSIQH